MPLYDDDERVEDYLDNNGEWIVPPQDPNDPVDPATWLAMDEEERQMRMVIFHLSMPKDEPHPPMENVRVHAVAHCIVENQLAEGVPATIEKFERLMKAGITRHHAIHALAEVIMGYMHHLVTQEVSADDVNERLAQEMSRVKAPVWPLKKNPSVPPTKRKIDRKKQKAKRKAGRKKR